MHRQYRVPQLHVKWFKVRAMFSEEFIALLLALLLFVVPAGASTRFENRGLFMQSTQPSAVTSYTFSLDYMTLATVGSLDMLFCVSPIPYEPCEVPAGLDVSGATLTAQTGETGFSILVKDRNHIVLSRAPTLIAKSGSKSTYTFTNIKNPSDSQKSFSVRLKSVASTDASGQQIDFGSVKGQVGEGITIETQVPPMLIFCAAEEVEDNCSGTNETYYTDMGSLSASSTLTAQSQMAVGTNATAGFVIAAYGGSLAAGTNAIDTVATPSDSTPGKNQFGINLVANDKLRIGKNPEGVWANAFPTTDYSQANKYKYVSGDVIAYSTSVSLMKKFTISYIVNSSPSLRAGVYTTTINYIASGRF